ncbi:MAG TPA: glucose-1-phosphate adenylyltransferase [Armatimonadetes bacterium]|nr:glucose-1-phosphate adenylyltransferase [Armatimonadota bacterium]
MAQGETMTPVRIDDSRPLAIVLAGGQGQRLAPLTNTMAKPAVRFGGCFRMIDFTLSNCINSGIRRIYILTQYASGSLNRHIRQGWVPLFSDDLGEVVELIPPQRVFAQRWYAGTADAVFQNIYFLQQERPEEVVLLSGDHAYKMDYSLMLEQHRETGAALTIACLPLPRQQCTQLGVLNTGPDGRVNQFVEKPEDPPPMPGDETRSLSNMAVYVWNTEALVSQLSADARRNTSHDFGKDIIPAMVAAGEPVYAYQFVAAGAGQPDYWRDIGTLAAYWEAHMALLSGSPALSLDDRTWPIYTYRPVTAVARICGEHPDQCCVRDVILSPGCVSIDAQITRSVLSPGVKVHGAVVDESVLMDDVVVEPGARVRRALVAEGVRIPANTVIGEDAEKDHRRFIVTDGGITVVPSRIVLNE